MNCEFCDVLMDGNICNDKLLRWKCPNCKATYTENDKHMKKATIKKQPTQTPLRSKRNVPQTLKRCAETEGKHD